MYNKKRDFLSFTTFFIGLWSIPFWCPFIIQGVVELFCNIIGLRCNLDIISKVLICIYCAFNILAGFAVKDEKEYYLSFYSVMSILMGYATLIYFMTC